MQCAPGCTPLLPSSPAKIRLNSTTSRHIQSFHLPENPFQQKLADEVAALEWELWRVDLIEVAVLAEFRVTRSSAVCAAPGTKPYGSTRARAPRNFQRMTPPKTSASTHS